MKLNNFKRNLKKEFKENYNKEEIEVIKKESTIKRPILIPLFSILVVLLVAIISIIPSNNKSASKVDIDEVLYQKYFSKDYIDVKALSEDEYNTIKKNRGNEIKIIPDYTVHSWYCSGIPYEDSSNYDTSPSKGDPNQKDNQYNTNNQVNGVDEGDISKFDGTYFYYLYNLKKDNNTMTTLSIFDLSGNMVLYKEDVLKRSTYIGNKKLQVFENKIVIYQENILIIYEFDGTNLKEEYSVSGRILDTRVVDDSLYVSYVSNISFYEDYTKDMYFVECSYFNNKHILTKYNLKTKEVKSVSVLGTNSVALYMDKNNIILAMRCNTLTDSDENYWVNYFSRWSRYSINYVFNLNLESCGAYITKGVVNDQYSIDIYNNQLRMVTTDLDKINRLTIFDLNEKIKLSCLEGIGLEGETVKSVTYKENICYVVTYKETDPLYSIDISNPLEPYITSELHVDGFSSYLKTFNISDIDYVFGAGEIEGNFKYSIYKNDGSETKVGFDLIVPKQKPTFIMDGDEYIYIVDDGATDIFINPHAMFFYECSNLLYIGAPYNDNKYVLYVVDVSNIDNVISEYKVFETDYESRMFLIDGNIYIPKVNNLIVDTF